MRERKIALPSEVTPESVLGYARLFQLEYGFRELVYLEMKSHFGPVWWTKAESALIRSKAPGIPAEKSLTNDKKHPHMATPENDPLWFLSFDSLLKIVFDDQHWPIFEPYLTTKELLEAKFTEVLPIRNRVGHNRSLHEDDLDRLRRQMRDLDQGFWRFCTSLNDTEPFIADLRSDPVFRYFGDRIGFDYAEVGPNQWALVGSTAGMSQNVMVEYSYRPSAQAEKFNAKGRLYHFRFSQTASNHRSLDFRRILENTLGVHARVAYIVLDSFQQTLRVSIPALYPADEVINAAERFYNACGNSFTFSFHDRIKKEIEAAGGNSLDEVETFQRPFQAMAAQWPHYIIPPGHSLEVLDPDCPCSFFEA